nr:hypothetical protein [Tanacetum cinerariifolium]
MAKQAELAKSKNNLRVFERDVKGTTASLTTTQKMTIVSGENTSSTNTVRTAYSVSFPSISKSLQEGSSSYTDEIIHSFFSNQSSDPQLDYDDLEHINDDMEEMDLKWQSVLIRPKWNASIAIKKGNFARDCRAKGNRKDVGYNGNKAIDNSRRPAYQENSNALVTVNGEDIYWSGHVEEDAKNYAMMAYSNSSSNHEVQFCSQACEDSYARLKKLYDEQRDKLGKPAESEGFEQIIDFLNRSSIRYALTASLTILTSCIKQFWSTAKVKTVNDEVRVQALIDAKRVNIKESSIRRTLKLDDKEGTSCLANDEFFTGLANMGYEKISDKLTLYKAFFLPQWKFLIHTIFSALVLKLPPGMTLAALWHHQSSVLPQTKSLTSQGDMSHHQDIYDNPLLTKKVFANMKRIGTGFSRVITPLFENMLVPPAEELELIDLCTRLSNKVMDLESEVIDIKSYFTNKIEKLKDRVHKIEEENKILKEKSFKFAKIETDVPVEDKEESFKHRRMIAYMDEDVEYIDEEEHAKVEEVLEVVTAAKLITEVVTNAKPTTTVAQVPKASALRKRRGVVIQDLEETATSVIMHTEVQPKDKVEGIIIEEPKPLKGQAQIKKDETFARQLETEINANINWNHVIKQVKRSERQNNAVMMYQALKRKPLTEARERKNMMIYLKNMAGFKMNFFKGMTYSEIRPLFEKHYNSNQAFLEKVEEEVTVQEKEIKEEELNNFSNDFLLNILEIMFEKPVVEVNVWKDQKGIYGLAKQMLNNVRHKVEEESKMSLELLRLVRRQLNEGYVSE